MLPRPLVIGLTVLIATMWAVNLVVGYLYGLSDPAVNAIFAIVAGAVYGLQRRTPKQVDQARNEDDRGDRS